MKKLLACCVLGLFVLPIVAEADDDIFSLNGKTYGCNLVGNQKASHEWGDDAKVQTLGSVSMNGKSYSNPRFECVVRSVLSGGDYWKEIGTNWCSGSDVKEWNVPDVKYSLFGSKGEDYGANAGAVLNGCILAKYKNPPAPQPDPEPAPKPDRKPAKCGADYVSFVVVQQAFHDEYLYTTDTGYSSVNGKISGTYDLNSGLAYECDNNWCMNNSVVTMPAGHVFRGEKVAKKAKYRCVITRENDYWMLESFEDDEEVKDDEKEKDNEKDDKKDDKKVVVTDRCTGMTGQRWTECQACKKLPLSEARWADPHCVCVDSNKQFDITTTSCVSKQLEDPMVGVEACKAELLDLERYVRDNCVSLVEQVTNLRLSCGTITRFQLNSSIEYIKYECDYNKYEEEKGKTEEKNRSRVNIIAAGKKLDAIVAGFGEANVWKNAQGEFNTARLASDSIAGVVLGTAGGLITSSVMKKKQAEQGFEDLKCVVGGQPVAGWGDEFNVGIQ